MYDVQFDVPSLFSDVYFYNLNSRDYNYIHKILLIKWFVSNIEITWKE